MRAERVIIFDSDGVNPYGAELAHMVSEWIKAELVSAADNASRPPAASFAPLRPTRRRAKRREIFVEAIRSLTTGVRLARGAIVVVVWARTYQKALLLIASSVRRSSRIVYISHNPGSGRDPEGGMRRFIERRLVGRAVVVTHSAALAEAARAEGARQTFAVPHLPYRLYCDRYGIGPRRRLGDGRLTLLLLGAMRPDKFMPPDISLLRDLLEATGGRFRLYLAIRPAIVVEAVGPGVEIINVSQDVPLDDAQIAAALNAADALVAPYRNATESGTVTLAQSAGLPVIAFSAGALTDRVPAEFLVPVGDWEGLAAKCRRLESNALHPAPQTSSGATASAAWQGVIRAVAG